MYKSNDLIGKPVISVDSGKQIGVIKDLICLWKEGLVKSLYLETGNIITKDDASVPISSFKKFAGDWVPLVTLEKLEELENQEEQYWTKCKGRKIVSNWGREIGFLTEICFSFPEGKIDHLEISDGLLKDFLNGREKILFRDIETFTENMIIIKEKLGGDT
ncbi:MAG: hypothetical protein APF76_08195 [Desulfitibacter sp. BRH_c19]|nr:MAG: hypothetical protein APF76_08195 [Desulfitibacter sp. BRH_c19]